MLTRWQRARFMPNVPLYPNQPKVTASKEHLELSRRASREGMVLLKNDKQVLPINSLSKLALFGKGVFDFVKGGGGSGDVTVEHVRNLYDGFTMREHPVDLFEPLCDYYRDEVEKQYAEGGKPGLLVEPEVPEELLEAAKAYTDTAIITISRFSGESWDRKVVYYDRQEEGEKIQSELSEKIFGESDYYLTANEQKMVRLVSESFEKVIVVLNVGGVVDTQWFAENDKISSVLLSWQGGMEGGLATADVLLGEISPCGKLADTFAKSLEDYPSTEGFHESPTYVNYSEDIYVGYRYFETLEGKADRVNYPFGYGLSYTTFNIEVKAANASENGISFDVEVTNTGALTGKEVVAVYVKAPQGRLKKASKSLVAFAKTKELAPNESQVITLSHSLYDMASYDDLGKVAKSAYVLEAGAYEFYIGNSVRDAKKAGYEYEVAEDVVIEQLTARCIPHELPSRMLSDGSFEELEQLPPVNYMENAIGWSQAALGANGPETRGLPWRNLDEKNTNILLEDVADGKDDLDALMAQLSDLDLAYLVSGQPNLGVADTFGWGNNEAFGIPSVMTADGPAGLRIRPERGVYTTAWPIATQLACTWDQNLIREVGVAAAEEVKENNLCVWLAPAMNIHRNPLCGRNFEYYSEDPFLTGKMAAAIIGGIQSMKVGATVKHFCCNNKETNRRNSDSRVSERALREIYLKGFEIAVKDADPWALMSSYNLVNGYRASENHELLEDILRGEWNFKGVVTSDWFTLGEHYKETLAGNDIKMGCGYPERLMMALEAGAIKRENLYRCAKRVLELILKLEA
ncbi:MAG: glycoside hydrolase family 3 C-terminal domain-containing protein [Lachnospiraceae bacterium]|nr:glycoside hydrolase family 3 C-terminal domain-containing protein [Lachnospiraceae bacterium]